MSVLWRVREAAITVCHEHQWHSLSGMSMTSNIIIYLVMSFLPFECQGRKWQSLCGKSCIETNLCSKKQQTIRRASKYTWQNARMPMMSTLLLFHIDFICRFSAAPIAQAYSCRKPVQTYYIYKMKQSKESLFYSTKS